MQSLIILGRQPSLGLAELESLYGAECISRVNENVVFLDIEPTKIDFNRLGGSIKLTQVLTKLDITIWSEIIGHLSQKLPDFVQNIPEGKIKLGLSVIDLKINSHEINKSGLQLKKVIKNTGRSVRVVPNTSLALNSAQILHNGLTSPTGLELVLVKSGNQTIVAQTVQEQDIEAYARRDQARPKRDAKVGMLPPKLAQIIINLSAGQSKIDEILDPFCGTGVLLQEAMLMGFTAYGTDLEPRMIEYSEVNLNWLKTQYRSLETDFKLEVADAIDYKWSDGFQTVASETYLGRAFTSTPDQNTLMQVISDCNVIHKKFLKNLHGQIQSGTPLCLAVPAWNTRNGFKHLPILDHLEELGYTRMSFVHVNNKDLIYYRDNQVVGRELVKLIRN